MVPMTSAEDSTTKPSADVARIYASAAHRRNSVPFINTSYGFSRAPAAHIPIPTLLVYRRFASLAPLKRNVEGLKPSTPPTGASCPAPSCEPSPLTASSPAPLEKSCPPTASRPAPIAPITGNGYAPVVPFIHKAAGFLRAVSPVTRLALRDGGVPPGTGRSGGRCRVSGRGDVRRPE